MHKGFGLPWMMMLVFLYTTPVMMITYTLISILINKTGIGTGIRTGAMGGILWGLVFTFSMGILTFFKHKNLERRYKRKSDYSNVQKRTIQVNISINEALALSAQTLRVLPWIQSNSIETVGSKISAKTSIVMGRNSKISISVISLAPNLASIEIECRPGHWLPVDCTLESTVNVEEISEEVTKLNGSTAFDKKNGNYSN